jgi:hypothetical protein
MTTFINNKFTMCKGKALGYLQCQFFYWQLFFLSALGAPVAHEALADADLLERGVVCPGEAIIMVTIIVEPALSVCLGVASAEPIDRSTMMEDTYGSSTISSPTTSPTL